MLQLVRRFGSSTLLFLLSLSIAAVPLSAAQNEVLRGQGSAVLAMAFSPADHLLASSGDDGSVRLWDTRSGDVVRTLVDKGEPVDAVAFSGDGRRVAAAAHDGRITVFDPQSGQTVRAFAASTFWCLGLALSPDGKLAACSSTGKLSVWDVESGNQVQSLTTWSGVLAWSPDGRFLAAGSTVIDLWDTATWRKARTLGGHAGEIRGLTFSPDGSRLATASIDHHGAAVEGGHRRTDLDPAARRGHPPGAAGHHRRSGLSAGARGGLLSRPPSASPPAAPTAPCACGTPATGRSWRPSPATP